jgi:hypothetical protein
MPSLSSRVERWRSAVSGPLRRAARGGRGARPGRAAVLGLAALRTPAEEIATTLRISRDDVSTRLERMLAALKPRLL